MTIDSGDIDQQTGEHPYELADRFRLEDGTVFDSSAGRAPLLFTVGAGDVLPMFESAVIGLEVGEKASVTIPPEDAYGVHIAEAVQVVPVDVFGEGEPPVGGEFNVIADDGESYTQRSVGPTEEHLLEGAAFAFLHDVALPGGASTGHQAEAAIDRVVSVISGEGMLYHRPTDGSPVFARPLRAGDAVLIRCGELASFANEDADAVPLRLLVLGLRARPSAMRSPRGANCGADLRPTDRYCGGCGLPAFVPAKSEVTEGMPRAAHSRGVYPHGS